MIELEYVPGMPLRPEPANDVTLLEVAHRTLSWQATRVVLEPGDGTRYDFVIVGHGSATATVMRESPLHMTAWSSCIVRLRSGVSERDVQPLHSEGDTWTPKLLSWWLSNLLEWYGV